jgi:glycine/D-amino acid oxidase-like deaminating enzyme
MSRTAWRSLRLSVPLWLVEMETEPIPAERIAALGWSSRSGVITQHQIMEHYRLTPRNTIVFGVRRVERGSTYPLPKKAPDRKLVEELADAFATRFPTLADVSVERAWGGWIAITSSWLSIAGQLGDNIYYSIACNGHGLAQAPYVGSLIADLIVDGAPHEDLDSIWAKEAKFPPFVLVGPLGLRIVWAVDRLCDLVNGSRRNARRAAAGAA